MALTGPNKSATTALAPRVWVPKSGVSIWEGACVGRYPSGASAGYIDNIGADPALEPLGIARHNAGSVPSGHTATFAAQVIVDEAIVPLTFPTGLATSDRNAAVYGVDENSASLLPVGPVIGYLVERDSATVGRVAVGPRFAAQALMRLSLLAPAARIARGVCMTNMSLSAFVGVSGGTAQNGVTYIKGDRVLLAGQTTAADNGIYVVGTVAAGTAPLARAADMPAGMALPNGSIVTVAEGTFYANSNWKSTATTTGGAVIGTNDPAFYPKTYKQTVTLAAGTYTIGFGSTATPDEPLYLLSGAVIQCTRNTAGGTLGTDGYNAPSASRVTGIPGTAVAIINSQNDAGTLGSSDTSTVDVLVINW